MATPQALVIDDSRAMRLILGDLLTDLGYEIHEAGDGQQAISLLEDDQTIPTLALVDWNMPVMNGLDFIKAVRERCLHDSTKLVRACQHRRILSDSA